MYRIPDCRDNLVRYKLSFLVYSMAFVDVRKNAIKKLNKLYY
ncbi:hypothetical protein ECEC1846_4920 [Escherichia coli EC1846]|uniref:Uncharacterized protein n=1 Tax=Escherichia coli EC1870 TaxID=1005554 RepID=A0AAV3H3N9_ECOLX|nr:hypothetical protein EDL933_4950 [Escherichia coli O157:H7 str. EDL933]EDU77223.1 hypothetical protein ECH7EC4401_1043 [Escherichia coli O157:H7 str. EC4401]EDU82870.1 hypothetical protein ECH7EC4486_4602 [Escherichia coli O157:H7 str. EC4486]EHU53881.1 hypothetical protein ECDEC3A_4704 [Escherichia coli DEC3A]EHV01557.1 hypothetical protein ECDEC4D_4616 [Escherichia coli DEC4D]EHV07925.1 hypothetical protein ECDEC4E_4688 [Escherichia coli DEC4E]EHV25220.1 hypothetical protein ECDEC5B_4850